MKTLRLIAIDGALDHDLHSEPAQFEAMYGVKLDGNAELVCEVVTQTISLLNRSPRFAPWIGYLAHDEENARIIGSCAFKDGPSEAGEIEIAYFTFPDYEGQGYATAMAAQLLHIAATSEAVREVVAHTLPETNASTHLLQKCGFQFGGEVVDPEDGPVWRWQKPSIAVDQ